MLTINNTLDGYLKDVEIKGNTIQDSENLADIRSVGDTVEGQELYEIPIVSCGKNLFDLSKLSGGEFTTLNGKNVYKYIDNASFYFYNGKFKKDTQYTITMTMFRDVGYEVKGLNLEIVYTDGTNKNFSLTHGVIRTITSEKGKTIEKLSGSYNHGLNAYIDLDSICLNEGDVAINYQPYIEDKLTILSPVQLEKVGDVADRIVCKDGVFGVEKGVITTVLDDTKVWIMESPSATMFGVKTSLSPRAIGIDTNQVKHLCYPLVAKKHNQWNSLDIEGTHIHPSGNYVFVNVLSNKLETLNIDGFKKWIKNNPVVIKYPTTTPQFIPLPHDQQVKLRTFANKTNISFGCEIEGTIKAQVPKSLGATVNTHTEQINNLNKELDRVKKLEESTVSTVTTESDFTTVEATSNGYFEDVKLEGKTLVNIHPKATPALSVTDRDNPKYNVTKKEGYIKVTGNDLEATSYRYVNMGRINFEMFKPNTTYTVIFTKFRGSSRITIQNGNSQHPIVKGGSVNTQDNKLLYTFVTTETLVKSEQVLYLWIDPKSTTVDVEVENPMIFEGDLIANPPSGYIEGLKSVGDGVDEVSFESVNENLFNGIVKKRLVNINGLIIEDENGRSTDYIEVPSNCDLTVSVKKLNQDRNGVVEYNANKEFICFNDATSLLKSGKYTFKTNINTKYIIYYYNSASQVADVNIPNHIMVTTSTTPIPYTPHQSDKKRLLYYNNETQTWEKPILREWDSIEKHIDGKYYYHQRSAEVVLNGSENWNNDTNSSTISPATYRQSIQFDTIDIPSASFNTKTSPNIISDLLPTVIFGDVYSHNHIGISISGTGSVGTHIIINNNFTDVTELKQWLQANNLTLVYQLAEEKVYECTNIDLITYANETNFIVESGVLSPKTTLKVHSNISNVVSLLQKKVSLLESNMTKYMITQNRLQLSSTHSADSVTFKVDYTVCSENMSQENYDTDLYNLILNNILVGKDNYNYDRMFNIIMDYASWSQISWDQFDILVGIMDLQHNPPIEPPIEEALCETPEE